MRDSSACIARDGELLFAVAEERISRVKHDASFPQSAIRACLDFAGIRAEQSHFLQFGYGCAGDRMLSSDEVADGLPFVTRAASIAASQ
jgi:predicted NodU family carbamoyl transferase